MTIPDYQSLMLPLLRQTADGEKRVADVEQRIADEFDLTQEEREELLPSGRQRVLHNRIHWAKFYMTKAGLLSSPARGRFVATEAGRSLLSSGPDRIDVKLLMQRPEFREFYKSGNGSDAEISERETGTSAIQLGSTKQHQKSRSKLRIKPSYRHCEQTCSTGSVKTTPPSSRS
jgi:restriction system protein